MTEMGREDLRQTEATARRLGLALMCSGSISQKKKGLLGVRLFSTT